MHRIETLWAIAVVAAGALIITWFGISSAPIAGQPGFPLDDAWIHVRFAQNLAQHGCFGFNPGEPTAGSTSPLWVVLLAGASLLSGDFLYTALFLSVLTYLLWGVSTYLVARKMFGENGPAILAALIVLVNVRVAWGALSGMEICLAGLLALVASASFAAEEATRSSASSPNNAMDSRNASDGEGGVNQSGKAPSAILLHSLATPVFFGLASLARPEAHLLFGIAVFLRIARSCRRDTPIRALLHLIPYRMIAIYLLVTMPWHLFSLWSSGSLLPNTFRANYRGLATRIYPRDFYPTYFRWLFVRDHPWVYWFLPLGMLVTFRWTCWPNRRSLFGKILSPHALALAQLSTLWMICYPAASRLILPMTRHHMRYMIPMTCFHAILAVLGLWVLVEMIALVIGRLRGANWKKGVPVPPANEETTASESQSAALLPPQWPWITIVLWLALLAEVILWAAPGLSRWAVVLGGNVYSVNRQHVAMAEWVKEHTPPDAVIATHDIGALGAISQRRIVDLFGLVTPAMIHTVDGIIPTMGSAPGWYLNRVRASESSYLIGYYEWLTFIREAPDCFEEIHREVLHQVDICGGTDLVAYRIHRDRLKEIPPIK